MGRILFWVFIVFLVWFAVRWAGTSRRRNGGPAEPTGAAPNAGNEAKTDDRVEAMRQCAWCGTHIPQHDALALIDGRVYCSAAHRDAASAAANSPR